MALQLGSFASVSEFVVVCINLYLFSYGYPSVTRTSLWEEGGAQRFNSDPKLRIYFYANHQEPPQIPYIWSQTSTDFNLGAAILAFWVLGTNLLLKWARVRHRWTELFLRSCVFVSWILCLISQLSGDLSDADHQSRVPWYLSHSCAIVAHSQNICACYIAQASFAFTILSIFLAIASMFVTVIPRSSDGTPKFHHRERRTVSVHRESIEYDILNSDED